MSGEAKADSPPKANDGNVEGQAGPNLEDTGTVAARVGLPEASFITPAASSASPKPAALGKVTAEAGSDVDVNDEASNEADSGGLEISDLKETQGLAATDKDVRFQPGTAMNVRGLMPGRRESMQFQPDLKAYFATEMEERMAAIEERMMRSLAKMMETQQTAQRAASASTNITPNNTALTHSDSKENSGQLNPSSDQKDAGANRTQIYRGSIKY